MLMMSLKAIEQRCNTIVATNLFLIITLHVPDKFDHFFLQLLVEADEKDGVDQAGDGAGVEAPGASLLVPLDREEDAQGPPDQEEGRRQD